MTQETSKFSLLILLRLALLAALTFAIGHYGIGGMLRDGGMAGREMGQAGDVPAPPRARFIGGMDAPDVKGQLVLRYVSQEDMVEVEHFYRNRMPGLGWTERPASGAEAQYPGKLLLYSTLSGNWCMIAISPSVGGDGSAVTIVRLSGSPRRPATRPAPNSETTTTPEPAPKEESK